MIDKQLVKEISNFIATFLGIFESFISTHSKNSEEAHIYSPLSLAFKVSGAIEGYLIVATKDQPGEKNRSKRPGYSAELVNYYNRRVASSTKQSSFRIDILNEKFADDIIYSARRAEPQITMRIQVKSYTIEFYAFTHSSKLKQMRSI